MQLCVQKPLQLEEHLEGAAVAPGRELQGARNAGRSSTKRAAALHGGSPEPYPQGLQVYTEDLLWGLKVVIGPLWAIRSPRVLSQKEPRTSQAGTAKRSVRACQALEWVSQKNMDLYKDSSRGQTDSYVESHVHCYP